MPTGYTAKLCDGPQTFEEFVMGCARAFGALVTMRDADADAAIPEEFKPDQHCAQKVEEAQARLAKFKAMDEAEAEQLAITEYDEALTAEQKRREETRAVRERLSAMKSAVRAWVPPTEDHAGMKKFMLDQLDTTLDFDGRDFEHKPVLVSGADHRLTGIGQAIKDIAYYSLEQAKEDARCKSRSRWVQALRESLKTKEAA